jgi:hypothetical protein
MLEGDDLAAARQVQLAAAPGFLGRAVACIGGANRAAFTAAEAVRGMAHCAECAALVLRQEGMVRGLTRLLDPAKANSE